MQPQAWMILLSALAGGASAVAGVSLFELLRVLLNSERRHVVFRRSFQSNVRHVLF